MQAFTLTALCGAFLLISAVQTQEDDTEYCDDCEDLPKNCSLSESITGGWLSYSEGGVEGSVLTYHCEPGHYAYPTSTRVCSASGEWSVMRQANGRMVAKATCKEMQCPAQLQLDDGVLWPRRQWFRPGEVQEFSCRNGFTLRGSAVRNCTLWGAWTGSAPVCDDQADDCSNPGTPPGALQTGDRFRVGEKVQYRCQASLVLLGSSERVCLESREWSGSEARCLAPFTFDVPESAARAMAGSLSGVMDVTSPEFKKRATTANFGRTINVGGGPSRLNIYILLDTSGSIKEAEFEKARKAVIALIHKLESYRVNMKFEIISYATEPKEIVQITSRLSGDVDHVLQELEEFDYKAEHGTKTGTNTHAALEMVYKRMGFLQVDKKSGFNETQHVMLIVTDGHSNRGNSPKLVLVKIRGLLGYRPSAPDTKRDLVDHTAEHLLDIYVFGVGDGVNMKELNALTSKKRDEQHIFILRDYNDLGKVFDKMISDSAVTMCGIAQEAGDDNPKKDYTRPWHVEITELFGQASKCKGSIVTENWILTAAHCFTPKAVQNPGTVKIIHGKEKETSASSVILHPQYNVRGLQHKKVKEFYDYDIALIKLKESIKLSAEARPICLPCTKPASSALKMDPNSTCDQHEKTLLPLEETLAHFLKEGFTRRATYIKTGSKRADCIKHAATIFNSNTTASVKDVITDRFLCTGGSQQYEDSLTCKGDSGGSLFLRKKHRYFQVAVVSWGNKIVCPAGDPVPADARDFHISVFSVLPWLKQHLNEELEFLPIAS
ncbi:hypothetical protein COCON_G00187000 [Conger conger]|uniref:C3/C5 convertase n=1 Tax=Conger conger TaxID=82655 RepID=A0A9Q1HR49_CONCO|nr:hypothetical protein COCON_G00187000 [Conger conger]